MNTKELRAKFLNEMGPFLIDEYTKVIKGIGTFVSTDNAARKESWDTLKQMMLGVQEAEKITCGTHSEIIQCLKEGVISIKDAKELMSIVQMQFEMTELAELAAKLDEVQKAA